MGGSNRCLIFIVLTMMLTMLSLSSCAPSRSTRMTADDFNVIAAEMSASLTKSIAISPRNADSPIAIITIDKVMNLTNDVMTESEQWYLMSSLQGSLDLTSLRRNKNIRFVIPAERLRSLKEHYDENLEYPVLSQADNSKRKPTHQMTGIFRSVTRVDPTGNNRTELYYFEATIIDLFSGESIWTDKFEYKRTAVGHIWD